MSREGVEVVALDLALDDGFRKRGLARKVVRLMNDRRETSGLELSDRIRLHAEGLGPLAEHFDCIVREVLAAEIFSGTDNGVGISLELDDELPTKPGVVLLHTVDAPR